MAPPFTIEKHPAGTAKGVFLLLHGTESHAQWFEHFLPLLTRAGYAAVAFDRPGSGRTPGPRGHLESYAEVLETTSRFATDLRTKYGPVHLAGHSWGGMAALYIALRRPWLFNSVTLIAPGIAALTDIPFTGKLKAAAGAVMKKTDRTVPTAFKPEQFTSDPDWREFIKNDPLAVRNVTVSFCVETLKMRRFIRQTAGKRRLPPCQCLLAGDDTIVDNRAAAAVCHKIGAAVQTFSHCRHTLVFEKPEATATALVQQADQANAVHPVGNVWLAGAGAVGGLTGSLLAFGGVDAAVLCKTKYCPTLQLNGLTLEAGQGTRNTGRRVAFAPVPEELPQNPDLLVVAVKSFDTDAVLSGLAGKIPRHTIILSLQNGLGNEGKIARAFPANTVVAASICASTEMRQPGRILWPDDRGGLAGALFQGSESHARNVWQNLLGRTGMECAWVTGDRAAERLKWSKLMLNTGFNALNSLTGMTSSEIMADPVFGRLVVAALREGFACMDKLGLKPVDLPGYPVSKLRLLLKSPEPLSQKAMAWQAKRSTEAAFSMRQDVLKNRQHTEISELNGAIVAAGHRLGLATPANAGLLAMVEKQNRKRMSGG